MKLLEFFIDDLQKFKDSYESKTDQIELISNIILSKTYKIQNNQIAKLAFIYLIFI